MRINPERISDPHVTSGLRESIELFLWFLPGLVIWMVLGAVLAGRVAAFLQTRRWLAFLLFVSLGLILGATLSPTTLVLESGASSSQCDFSRLGVLSAQELAADFDAIVNILLFAALGLFLGLLPRTRRNALLMLSAFFLTVLIELTQLLLPGLGRGCETADMIDNTLGLVLGLITGIVARMVLLRSSGSKGVL
jgi:hypothetical protein